MAGRKGRFAGVPIEKLALMERALAYGEEEHRAKVVERWEAEDGLSIAHQIDVLLGLGSPEATAQFLSLSVGELIKTLGLTEVCDPHTPEGQWFCDKIMQIAASSVMSGMLIERGMERARSEVRRRSTRGQTQRTETPTTRTPRSRPR